jgi:hypothetical protein
VRARVCACVRVCACADALRIGNPLESENRTELRSYGANMTLLVDEPTQSSFIDLDVGSLFQVFTPRRLCMKIAEFSAQMLSNLSRTVRQNSKDKSPDIAMLKQLHSIIVRCEGLALTDDCAIKAELIDQQCSVYMDQSEDNLARRNNTLARIDQMQRELHQGTTADQLCKWMDQVIAEMQQKGFVASNSSALVRCADLRSRMHEQLKGFSEQRKSRAQENERKVAELIAVLMLDYKQHSGLAFACTFRVTFAFVY